MDTRDLSTEQCEIMGDRLGAYLRYLHRVKRRMEARGSLMPSFRVDSHQRQLATSALAREPKQQRQSQHRE
jgi:hypothetical protein